MRLFARRGRAVVAALLVAGGLAHAQSASLGNLAVPAGPGPHPTVLLLHGCSGILENQAMWQEYLRELGYASASLDSFGPRRIPEICTNFRRLPMHDRVNDAYDALVQLAGRPEVDARRVAVMGFSNGAVATLAALSSIVATQLVPGSPRFAAGIALYPDCSPFSPNFSAPILVLIGELDDWTPAAACTALQGKIQAGRPSFSAIVLPKAHHSFDVVNQTFVHMPDALNNHRRGGRGATVAGSWRATETAKQEIRTFLARELGTAR